MDLGSVKQKCERQTGYGAQCRLDGYIRVSVFRAGSDVGGWSGWVCGNHLRWLRKFGDVNCLERNDGYPIGNPVLQKLIARPLIEKSVP